MVRAAKGNQRIALLKNSLKVNITWDDLVSVGQLQTETMLTRTQRDDAQTTIHEMENLWYNEHVYIMNCDTHCKIY